MKNQIEKTSNSLVRKKAEESLKAKGSIIQNVDNKAEMQALVHELEVHQIELEMQNSMLEQAHKVAAEAVTKYRLLYDMAPSGYITLTPQGEIVELNIRAAELLGKDRFKLFNSQFDMFIQQDFKPKFWNFLDDIFALKSKMNAELMVLPNNHASRCLWLTGMITQHPDQCFVALIDISNLKIAEKELMESKEKLQELNATKDKFFSIIGHDLRSPFNSILSFAELLVEQLRENNYQDLNKYAEIIYDSANRAVALVNNLLEWSRIQTGRISFEPTRFDLSAMIDETILLYADAATKKNISLKKRDSELVEVFADSSMIDTVIRNLVSNALKFTHPGGKVTVSATQNAQGTKVSVEDNGVGIPAEAMEELFRVDSTYVTSGTNKERGTGLGLVLCKEFIDMHHGKIWVESKKGEGSAFSFILPKIFING